MASIQSSLPPVAYTKAVDVWTGMCVFFVFCSLLEYAFVNYAARADQQRQRREAEEKSREIELCIIKSENNKPMELNCSTMDPLLERKKRETFEIEKDLRFSSFLGLNETEDSFIKWLEHFQLNAKQIDVSSRILFPSSFLIFTVSYWLYYTQTTEIPHLNK